MRLHKPIQRSLLVVLLAAVSVLAGYKARPWKPRGIESYPAKQSSQGVTIAVDPLFRDAIAAQVFDKDDLVSKGIMPLAIVVFNDNDFPVRVSSDSIELVQGEDRMRPRQPEEFVPSIFKTSGKRLSIPVPVPRGAIPRGTDLNDPMQDFSQKAFPDRPIPSHSTEAGFLYFSVPQTRELANELLKTTVYIPEVTRLDSGKALMYFEIDLKPAIDAVAAKP